METVTFADDVTKIASNLLHGCGKITQIDIPDGVTYIGNMAFRECAMAELNLPEGLKKIGVQAFNSVKTYTSLKIPIII